MKLMRPNFRHLRERLDSIRFRIVASFLAALLALIAAQGFLLWHQASVTRSLTLIASGYLPLTKVIAQLDQDHSRVENDLDRLLRDAPRPGTGATSSAVIYTDQLKQNLTAGTVVVENMQLSAEAAEERAVLNKLLAQFQLIDTLFQEYERHSTEFVQLAETGRREEALLKKDPMLRNGNQLTEEIDRLDRLVDSRVAGLTRSTDAAQRRATAIAASLSLSALLLSLLLMGAVLVALRPIERLTSAVQQLAAGDYSGKVDVQGSGEIAILAGEFNAMIEALRLRDSRLVERAEELRTLSGYLQNVLHSLTDSLFVVENDIVALANPASTERWAVREGQAPPSSLQGLLHQTGWHERKTEDGRVHQIRVHPFGDQGLIVVATDITELNSAKEQLARSERLALIGQMLAQITHEVRNPLNALSLNTELLGDEFKQLDPKKNTDGWNILQTISSEIERLHAVTEHYLQLTRRPPSHPSAVDLTTLFSDIRTLINAELQQQGVTLTLEIDATNPQWLDGNQLRQAILNIIRNAIEAGADQLTLSCAQQKTTFSVTLQDNGPGMTQQQLEQASDPFFSTKASGTGLGLAITKQIVEDHGGHLQLTSEMGSGTTIALVLPYKPVTMTEQMHASDHLSR